MKSQECEEKASDGDAWLTKRTDGSFVIDDFSSIISYSPRVSPPFKAAGREWKIKVYPRGWGWPKFLALDEIKKRGWLHDGRLVVTASIREATSSSSEEATSSSSEE